MKLLGRFSSSTKKVEDKSLPCDEITCVDSSVGSHSEGRGGDHKQKKKKKDKKKKMKTRNDKDVLKESTTSSDSAEEDNTNIKIVEQLLSTWTGINPENAEEKVQGALALYAHDARTILEDGMELKAEQVLRGTASLFESFPDLKFTYESIEAKGVEGNIVYVDGLQCTGTHTGKPFTIMPGVFPEVAPSGKYCENDEERLRIEINRNGKIQTVNVYAMGSASGLLGLYEAAGGSLTPPPPQASSNTTTTAPPTAA